MIPTNPTTALARVEKHYRGWKAIGVLIWHSLQTAHKIIMHGEDLILTSDSDTQPPQQPNLWGPRLDDVLLKIRELDKDLQLAFMDTTTTEQAVEQWMIESEEKI